MTFSELLAAITATYLEQSRRYHVLATRYYRGKETRDTLARYLTPRQVDAIIANR